MPVRSRRASSLLALNWILFGMVYVWISVAQGNLLWWLRLYWGSWLSDFASLSALGQIPSGSVWILWLMISLTLTAIYLPAPRDRTQPEEIPSVEPVVESPMLAHAELMESRPELKEKILRLHQSLDKI